MLVSRIGALFAVPSIFNNFFNWFFFQNLKTFILSYELFVIVVISTVNHSILSLWLTQVTEAGLPN